MGEEGRPQLHAVVEEDEAGYAAIGEERVGIRLREDAEVPLTVSVVQRPFPYPATDLLRKVLGATVMTSTKLWHLFLSKNLPNLLYWVVRVI